MTSSLNGDEMIEYMLSAVEFLRNDDLEGWKQEFTPTESTPVIKNLRQTPVLAPVLPLPTCTGCGGDRVIDDVINGQYVCITCGLIQTLGVFTGGPAHCSMDRLKNVSRVYIHRYSRVVHFLTTVRLLQGDSAPVVSCEDMQRLRVEVDGGDGLITVEKISRALRKLGLARRYRRHRYSLLGMMTGVNAPLYDGTFVLTMAKMFRRLEYYWNYHKKTIAPTRRVFFSYRFVFYQLARQLGQELDATQYMLRSPKLNQLSLDSYARLCEYTGFSCFE